MKRLLLPLRQPNKPVRENVGGTRPPRGFFDHSTRGKALPEVGLHRSFCALLAVFAATSALASLVPTEWQYRQKLNVTAAGLTRVDLPAASFDAAGPDQQDFRIVDSSGREIAYLLDRPPAPTPRLVRPAAFDIKVEPGSTRLLITTGVTTALTSLVLETPHPFFLRSATVEISDDNTQWTTLDQGVPLFRQWGAEKLELPLAHHSAAYLRITLNDQRGAPVAFTGALLNVNARPAPTLVPIAAEITRRDEFAGETVATLSLDGRHVPLAALELPAGDPLFMRRVTVSVRDVNGGVSSERTVGSGTIYRVALDGSPTRSQLEIPLDFTPDTRELLVHVHNGDSPPLAFDTVQPKRRVLNLLFMAPAPGAYTLLSGNPQASAPRYDLAVFASELREANPVTIIPGSLETTPDYHPRDSLGAPSMPDVPLEGAPLDAKDWAQRRTVQLTHAGVQELELDPAALAKAQSDFGDLRLLRGENQIPYVLEQPALSRSVTLKPSLTRDPKRPSVSTWQIKLSHAGLPLRRLVLSSATPLFQRQFRIFEKLTNQESGAYELTLASGNWSRTPEPGVPETRVFEIDGRTHTDTLWIETNDGDNPAIALDAVQAIYPVARMIFKTAEPGNVILAYGNPLANAPRYDLSLVAVKLLTAPRHPAKLDAGESTSGAAKDLFAGLSGGPIFWAALGLVVVVLLVVVAKLLPKPPVT